MEKAEYLFIKSQLSFSRPLWITLAVLVADLALFAFAMYLITLKYTAMFLISQMLMALFFFHSFAMLHEAGHGNLHRLRWVNTFLGHYFSVFCFIPYFVWNYTHPKHHLWAGSINKDPTMRILEKLKQLGRIPLIYSIAWRIWIPLPAAGQHVMFWLYPFRLLKEYTSNKRDFYRATFSVLFLASTYYFLYLWFPNVVTIHNFGLSIFLYLMLTEVINLPHHTHVPHFYSTPNLDRLRPWQQHITTRSCHYAGILSELIAMNFNLHIEHHFFPNLPWYRLKKARDLLKPRLGDEYMDVNDVCWNRRIRALSMTDVILTDVDHPILHPGATRQ